MRRRDIIICEIIHHFFAWQLQDKRTVQTLKVTFKTVQVNLLLISYYVSRVHCQTWHSSLLSAHLLPVPVLSSHITALSTVSPAAPSCRISILTRHQHRVFCREEAEEGGDMSWARIDDAWHVWHVTEVWGDTWVIVYILRPPVSCNHDSLVLFPKFKQQQEAET